MLCLGQCELRLPCLRQFHKNLPARGGCVFVFKTTTAPYIFICMLLMKEKWHWPWYKSRQEWLPIRHFKSISVYTWSQRLSSLRVVNFSSTQNTGKSQYKDVVNDTSQWCYCQNVNSDNDHFFGVQGECDGTANVKTLTVKDTVEEIPHNFYKLLVSNTSI